MFFLVAPILFLSIFPIAWEPLNFGRSFILIIWLLLFVLTRKNFPKVKLKIIFLIPIIIFTYTVSAIVNKQNYIQMLIGHYNRNMGVITLVSIFLILYIITTYQLNIKSFIRYGFWPTAILTLGYGYIQYFELDPLTWGESDRTVLTLGNSNFAAVHLVFICLFILNQIFFTKSRNIKLVLALNLLLIFNLGLFTQAFQFRVLLSVGLIVFLSIYYFEQIRNFGGLKNTLFLSGISLFIITYTTVKWDQLDLISRTGSVDRIESSLNALRVFKDYPITGVGIEQFWKYSNFYKSINQERILGDGVAPDKAHNVFIDHFANGGVIAGIAFIAFIVFSLIIIYRLNNSVKEPLSRNNLAMISSIWITYTASLFISTDMIYNQLLSYICLGFILKLYYFLKCNEINTIPISKHIYASTVMRLALLPLLIILLILGFRGFQNNLDVNKILNGKITTSKEILTTLKNFPNPKGVEFVSIFLLNQNRSNCSIVNESSSILLIQDQRSAQAYFMKAICADFYGQQELALTYIDKSLTFYPFSMIYLETKLRLELYLLRINPAQITFEKMESIDPNFKKKEELLKLMSQ
jgi:O-antigen ligase